MPGLIEVRRGSADDVEAIVRNGVRMFESMGETNTGWAPSAEMALREGIEQGRVVAVVAEDAAGARVIVSSAVAVLSERLPTPWNERGRGAYVQYVWTEPQFRRQGIARRVMDELVRLLRASHVSVVELHAAPMAQSIYAAMGFTPPHNPALRLAL